MVNLPRSMAASRHQVLSRSIFAGCSPTVLRRLGVIVLFVQFLAV